MAAVNVRYYIYAEYFYRWTNWSAEILINLADFLKSVFIVMYFTMNNFKNLCLKNNTKHLFSLSTRVTFKP